MKTEAVLNTAAIIVTICTVLITGLFVRRELTGKQNVSVTYSKIADWETYARGGQLLGRADADVTIIEFSDFQCPFCRMISATLREIVSEANPSLSHIYRHFPLKPIHPHAFAAAVASECAAVQGRFREYHDALFDNQDSIGVTTWVMFAQRSGVRDTTDFKKCLQSDSAQQRVQNDIAEGARLGVDGTPTLLINNLKITGSPDRAEIEKLIKKARKSETKR